MTGIRRRIWVWVLAILVLTGVAAAAFCALLPTLLDPNRYRNEILRVSRGVLHRDLTFVRADISCLPPRIDVSGLEMPDRDGVSPFLSVETASFRMAFLPLLRGRVVLDAVSLDRPRLSVVRHPDGRLNLQDLLEGPSSLQIRRIRVRDGQVAFADRWVSRGGHVTTLTGLDLRIADLRRGERTAVALSARGLSAVPPAEPGAAAGPVVDPRAAAAPGHPTAAVSLNGTLTSARPGEPLTASRFDGRLSVKGWDLGMFRPYWAAYGSPVAPEGRLDLSVTGQGSLARCDVRAEATLTTARIVWPAVFSRPLTPATVRVQGRLKREPGRLALDDVRVETGGLRLAGGLSLSDLATDDPLLSARVTSPRLSMTEARPYVPFGILPPDTGAFFRDTLREAVFTGLEGRIQGRLSRIRQMDRDDNARVLSVQTRVEQGVLSFGAKVPPFKDIAGRIRFAGRDILFENITGRFGLSSLSLSGRITDYPLAAPSRYPFAAIVQPRPTEVRWLLGEAAGTLRISGSSVLKLDGDGTLGDYRLTGLWDATAASWRIPGAIAKPAGVSNRIRADLRFVPGEVRIAGLVCDLAALSVTADGAVPFDRGRPFQVNVRSGALPVEHLAPYLTPLAPYRPVGTIRLDLAGRGAAGADGLRWQGQIHLKDGGFQPPGGLGPVRAVNGSFRWTETGLSAQDLSARLGQSPITASLFVGGRRHPDVRVRLACPRLNLQDAGLRHPRGEGVLTDIDLQAARRNGTWRIQSLTAAMNRTTVQAQGVLRETPEPVADLSLVFPSLDGGDVAFLAGLKGADPSPGQARSRLWKVVVRVGDGRAEGVAFKNLYAGLRFQNGLLDIADGQADVFGGRVRGTGRIDFTAQGRPSYDVRFALERIRAEQVAPPFQGKHGFLAGSLSADGQVKAAGAGWPDLLRTAQGSLSLRCESGTIRKFAVLSKVFSILNVSQLFRFELPDMAAGGMPYDAITGRLTLSDGVIATKDLFIASDAMNLSFVGTVDLVRESLDQTIGVQPLQTVDRLVRRLPIVGWVLSDQDGRVLTVYFEARGPFDNPVVRPIPVRSMSKGVQEIFRNLFHLPVKLFTDTGEVLFGR